MDHCRVWESHSEQDSGPGVDLDQDPLGRPGVSREPRCLRSESQGRMECPVVDPRVPVSVASVISSDVGTQRKVGNGDSQLAPLEVISSLVTRLLRTAQANVKVPPEEGMGSSSAVPAAGGAQRGHSGMEWARGVLLMRTPGTWDEPVFAGGHLFSVLAAGLVGGCPGSPISGDTDLECGLLREARDGTGGRVSLPDHLTPAGEMVDQGEATRHGSCRWGEGLDTVGHRACMLFCHWGAIPQKFVGRITDSCRSGPSRCWEA